MHLLGLVPGSVLMCKCVGQFSCRGPACRKFWNTPRSPSCSQSRSPARYLHRAFRDGAMREERVSLVMRECKRFPAVIFRFKASTHTTTLLRPVPPLLCPWLPPPHPRFPPRRQVAPPSLHCLPRGSVTSTLATPAFRPNPPAPEQSGPQPADVDPEARPPPCRSGRIRCKPG